MTDAEVNRTGYISLAGEGEARLEVKHSVFIAHASPVKSDEEARGYLQKIKREYSDAKHNCYAYVIKDGNFSRYSDDGEPGGTAGLPIMNVIKGRDVTNAVVVVTRYFGGILLGTGGLVRAYTDSASAALEAARPALFSLHDIIFVRASYSDYQKLSYEISRAGALTDDVKFEGDVKLTLSVKREASAAFSSRISEITAGRAEISRVGERFFHE
ncbi:MAG: IMPACT family protein [Firmicutes bacterium]|nr:IMPACT family protein [Bacillota bacterium]